MKYDNVLDLIGNTPLVKLENYSGDKIIYAKLEKVNLAGSIKDRVAKVMIEKAIEDGNDPSPKDIQQLQQDIQEHRIAFFVNNKQSQSKTIDNLVALAKENHVPVLNVTESQPNGKTYRQWMLGQYRQLYRILQRGE